MRLRSIRLLTLATASAALVAIAHSASPPVVGSANTATAEPPIATPNTPACVVPLYANLTFADFSPQPFSFTPACTGPFSKIVLAADFAVTAGRQFDRTGSIWLGGTNLYFGTTAEPSRAVAPSWHIENDLTELAPLFATAQPGMVQLDNLVNETFTGILSGSAELRFYRGPAPRNTADLVLPLSSTATGGAVGLATPTDTLARTFTLPRNVERAFLDVIAQSQSGDEFWWTCVPDELAGPLQSCGGASFREAEISVDNQPAGVAPIYPWIFTGGIDPNLWKPIPSVQTLNFKPYRVDLTPFAGLLADGAPHTIAVSVAGANNFFATTATLLVYRDPHAARTSGAVTANTLAAPAPTVTSQITTAADGTISGPVDVTGSRHYRIAGFVDTSHGRVRAEVTGDLSFANRQTFEISSALYHQHIAQTTTAIQRTTLFDRGIRSELVQQRWPLAVDFQFASHDDGSAAQTTTVDQRFERSALALDGLRAIDFHLETNAVTPTDTLNINASGVVTGSTNQTSAQHFFTSDLHGCFRRDITAAAGVVTSVSDGRFCH